MSIAKEAVDRIRRIRAGVETSQVIYGVEFDPNDRQAVHDANVRVKRLMLDDERAIVDAYLAEHTADEDEPPDVPRLLAEVKRLRAWLEYFSQEVDSHEMPSAVFEAALSGEQPPKEQA